MGNHIFTKRSSDYIILNLAESKLEQANLRSEDPIELSRQLQRLILKLKGAYIITDKAVDYKSLVENRLFKDEYLNLAKSLIEVNLEKLVDNETSKTAFFINVYNSLTLHGIAHLYQSNSELAKAFDDGEEKSVLSQLRGKFWSRIAYCIGGYGFSLDDIEHGILRSNSPHPSTLFNLLIAGRISGKMFDSNDPRLKFSVKNLDPRIHFALNCGAKSCPPILAYSSENLDKELDLAARNFINSELEIDLENKKIKLSQLFKWYRTDFCCNNKNDRENQQLLDYLIKFSDEEKKELLNKLKCNSSVKIEYYSYNWNMNMKN